MPLNTHIVTTRIVVASYLLVSNVRLKLHSDTAERSLPHFLKQTTCRTKATLCWAPRFTVVTGKGAQCTPMEL